MRYIKPFGIFYLIVSISRLSSFLYLYLIDGTCAEITPLYIGYIVLEGIISILISTQLIRNPEKNVHFYLMLIVAITSVAIVADLTFNRICIVGNIPLLTLAIVLLARSIMHRNKKPPEMAV
jgi:hypothetical protein